MSKVVEVSYRPEETAGYCSRCNQLVVRDESAACSHAGHEPEFIRGLIVLSSEGEIPYQLPRFNWAAALFPPLWGPAHGAWAGAVMLPLYLFVDSALQAAVDVPAEASFGLRLLVWLVSLVIVVGTLAFSYRLGRRGWGIAWARAAETGMDALRLSSKEDFDDFIRRERRWFPVCLALFMGLMALAVYWWTIR